MGCSPIFTTRKRSLGQGNMFYTRLGVTCCSHGIGRAWLSQGALRGMLGGISVSCTGGVMHGFLRGGMRKIGKGVCGWQGGHTWVPGQLCGWSRGACMAKKMVSYCRIRGVWQRGGMCGKGAACMLKVGCASGKGGDFHAHRRGGNAMALTRRSACPLALRGGCAYVNGRSVMWWTAACIGTADPPPLRDHGRSMRGQCILVAIADWIPSHSVEKNRNRNFIYVA